MEKKLYRIPEQGKITGVCAGLAEYLSLDVTLVRVLAVVAIFITSGVAILIYFVAALIMPVKDRVDQENYGSRAEGLVKEVSNKAQTSSVRNWLGIGLMVLGAWYLLEVIWPSWANIRWSIVWPIILIIVGVLILVKGRR